jgi:hypothetical protein
MDFLYNDNNNDNNNNNYKKIYSKELRKNGVGRHNWGTYKDDMKYYYIIFFYYKFIIYK